MTDRQKLIVLALAVHRHGCNPDDVKAVLNSGVYDDGLPVDVDRAVQYVVSEVRR